jgi:hypothetical protein
MLAFNIFVGWLNFFESPFMAEGFRSPSCDERLKRAPSRPRTLLSE